MQKDTLYECFLDESYTMNTLVTFALAQCDITHLDPTTNITRAETFIQQAKAKNAHVVIFPEDFLTGSIFGDTSKLDRDHHFENIFQNFAKTYSIDIVAGSWMEQTPSGPKSTSTYIDAAGTVLGRYHKNHLYLSERHFLTPGTEVCVFDTAYGRAGIIICWDILFSEIFIRMKQLGVQIVYCPSYWYKEIAGIAGLEINQNSEEDHIDALCRARAVEFGIVCVYVNTAGVQAYTDGSKDTLLGHSQIALPIRGTVAKIATNEQKMILQTIDLSVLDLAENTYKLHPSQ